MTYVVYLAKAKVNLHAKDEGAQKSRFLMESLQKSTVNKLFGNVKEEVLKLIFVHCRVAANLLILAYSDQDPTEITFQVIRHTLELIMLDTI